MSWKYAPSFDAAHRAAIAGGKPLIFVCPPAAWATRPLLELVASRAGNGLSVLALVPDVAFGHDLTATLRTIPAFEPVHFVPDREA